MMTNFKLIWKNQMSDPAFLVPLYTWASGKEANIEMCQDINRMFFSVDKKILNTKLVLNNKLNHFMKFPKKGVEDEKELFYKRDVARYFGWTLAELEKNIKVIDFEGLKESIATLYGYEKNERRKLGIK